MRDRITFTPQHYREKAKSLRELALQTSDLQERRELLVVAMEMATLGAELAKSWAAPLLSDSPIRRGEKVN